MPFMYFFGGWEGQQAGGGGGVSKEGTLWQISVQ